MLIRIPNRANEDSHEQEKRSWKYHLRVGKHLMYLGTEFLRSLEVFIKFYEVVMEPPLAEIGDFIEFLQTIVMERNPASPRMQEKKMEIIGDLQT